MEELTKRQQAIYNLITKSPAPIAPAEILERLDNTYDLSRATLARDLSTLAARDLIKPLGAGPTTAYVINSTLLGPINPESYFTLPQDQRTLTAEPNSEFFDKLATTNLLPNISNLSRKITDYRKRVADLPLDLHAKELERFTVDFAWKSASLEGNTYSQIETETLLKYREQAEGHSEAEAIMIINHKATFDRIRNNLANFKKLNLSDILDVHQSLTQGLGVEFGIRKHAVRITGTNYLPLDNQFAITENLSRAIDLINAKTNTIEKALLISALLIYLQPFSDGNKRTARMIGNAVLMAGDIAPISYRNTDDSTYKKSVLLIDEQHNLYAYRQLFLDALEFSTENYAA
ncbi:MAG: Fic family protein [Candidatus Nomurabacteria bacterium]|jgi:Fic family protein|nr:Fic family protein [Candidatus Nomurabacteria bacterium]